MIGKYIKYTVWGLLLVLLGVAPLRAQSLYDQVYTRALRMSPDNSRTALSSKMNHIWMAYLADSLQPSALVDLAGSTESVATVDLLERAFRKSDHDLDIGLQLMVASAYFGEWSVLRQTKDALLQKYPDDKQVLFLLMEIYEKSQQQDQAIEVLRGLLAKDRSNSGYTYSLVDLLIASERYDEALKILQGYLLDHPGEIKASLFVVMLLQKMGQTPEVGARVVDELMKYHPSSPKAITVQVIYLSGLGKYDEMAKVIESYGQMKGSTADEIGAMLSSAFSNAKDKIQMMGSLVPMVKRLNERYQDDETIQGYALNYYLLVSDSIQATKEAIALIAKGAKVRKAYEYTLNSLIAKEATDSIGILAKQALQVFPNDAFFLLNDLFVYSQKQPETTELLKKVDAALSVVSEKDRLYPQFLAIKADALEKIGNWDEARRYYEKVVETGHIMGTNNFAYFLTKHGNSPEDLELAEKLAASVVKASPDEPTYLDTYAWILYKRSAYSLAKVYMERALGKSDEESSVYYEHYAYILKALKEYDAAIEAWRKALEHGADADLVSREVLEIQALKGEAK